MADRKLRLYHRFPSFLQSVVASVRGVQLQGQRYGPETEELVAEALERDYWSAEQWRTYQEDRLTYMLHRAATQVAYYRDQWSERRRKGDRASPDYLENWTILNKEPVRMHAKAFIADDQDIRQMFHVHTSGTSGMPLHIYKNKTALRAWYALFEARWRRWYGVSRKTRWGILGGQLVVSVQQRKPPFWTWNRAMNQLYMSSYHLSPQTIPFYLEAIEQFRIEYLYAYTSSVFTLADEIVRSRLSAPRLKLILTNAEPLYEHQRQRIAQAFGCLVKETYGQAEAVIAASECEMGNIHLWPEVGYYEVVEAGLPIPKGQVGDIVSTGLLNDGMILVRYRLGDRLTIAEDTATCPCGRGLPLLEGIEGRVDDVLFTSDGRRIGRLDPVFKSDFAIREAQIIQDHLDHLTVRVVAAPGYDVRTAETIREQLQKRFGRVEVMVELVDQIPRTNNGKFRAVVCNLPPEERQRVQ